MEHDSKLLWATCHCWKCMEHFKAMLLQYTFLPNKFNLSLFSLCQPSDAPFNSISTIPLPMQSCDVGHFKGQTTKQTSNSHIARLNDSQGNDVKGQMKTGWKSITSSHEYKRIQMHKCGYHDNVLQFICRRNWQSFDRSALSNHRPVIRSVS